MAIAMSYAPLATAYAALRNASEPVAQKFSTCVTGLSCSCNGRASAIPLMPDIAVPSQYASTSSLVTPADLNASSDASMSKSSVPLFQCSPNGVQPMPTIATLSLMPCELMVEVPFAALVADRPGLPEVIVDLVGGEEAPERHLHSVTDLECVSVGVGEFDGKTTAAVPVDHRERD